MIKTLFIAFLLFQPLNEASFQNVETTVFVCTGDDVERYHLTDDCRGLNACNHDIVKMELEEAKKEELTLCHWED